jgi:hypothetical protein
MASTHNTNHQECVNKLILALKPLSDSINRFAQNYYSNFYEKLSQLNWGPFAPRSFGIFPMISINYNIISKYHLDKNDHENSLHHEVDQMLNLYLFNTIIQLAFKFYIY